jgi:hypothetical protein
LSNPMLPDSLELQGVEHNPAHIPSVPVVVEGPVRVEALPSRLGDARTVKIRPARVLAAVAGGDYTPRQNEDPRRRKMILISTDKPFYYALGQEAAENGTGALWPANVALVIEHCAQFFLTSADAAGTTLTIIREDWSQ